MRVLVAEDDDTLGAVLAQGLRSRGYVVDLVADGESALSYARCYEYAVAVLDWLMPRVSGIDVVRQLRRLGARTPVLMISGKGAPEDRVAGLDAGADDYLVKPFAFDELFARLRALQRRPPDVLPPRLVVGDLECDPASREVTFSGRRPALTSTELSILETLMRFSPAVADRRQIAQHVWTNEVDTFSSNTIDVHLARLRAKLSGSRVRIQTVRGVGYRIVADNGQRLAGRRGPKAPYAARAVAWWCSVAITLRISQRLPPCLAAGANPNAAPWNSAQTFRLTAMATASRPRVSRALYTTWSP